MQRTVLDTVRVRVRVTNTTRNNRSFAFYVQRVPFLWRHVQFVDIPTAVCSCWNRLSLSLSLFFAVKKGGLSGVCSCRNRLSLSLPLFFTIKKGGSSGVCSWGGGRDWDIRSDTLWCAVVESRSRGRGDQQNGGGSLTLSNLVAALMLSDVTRNLKNADDATK